MLYSNIVTNLNVDSQEGTPQFQEDIFSDQNKTWQIAAANKETSSTVVLSSVTQRTCIMWQFAIPMFQVSV
jgi:hypothetical protein